MLRNKALSVLICAAVLLLLTLATTRDTSAISDQSWAFHGDHCQQERCMEWTILGVGQHDFCCETDIVGLDCARLQDPAHHQTPW